MPVESANRFEVREMEEIKGIEKNESEDLLEMYESAFSGSEQQLSLAAVGTFNRLIDQFEKEEIRRIAEILKALATAPTVLQR
ncbi:hypothetical protein [Enterococcus gallinarum]|uniref:hypothetical protein n=2 Tax=Enterococcus gallinarum TaxID=1353 RepID=UPI001AD71E4E|nr:hypothetical protein [Enterococcus gallinarum]